MISSINEKRFFSQKVRIKKKYTNRKIKLYHFFHQRTNLYPENVIVLKNFIFYFVKNADYFKAKRFLKSLRMELQEKILIIRAENTLIRLIISFFPDTYIHDITLDNGLEKNVNNKKNIITLLFIFYKDRGIAIGRSGGYINVVNEIFEKYIFFEDYSTPIEIKCDFINL